jgi:hypothetical protein
LTIGTAVKAIARSATAGQVILRVLMGLGGAASNPVRVEGKA